MTSFDCCLLCIFVFSSAGRQVISGGFDKVVRLWNTTTLQPILQQNGNLNAFELRNTQAITSVAFSEDGSTVLTASFDKWIRMYASRQ